MIYKRATTFLWLWVYCLLASFTTELLAAPELDVETPISYAAPAYQCNKSLHHKAGSNPLPAKYNDQDYTLLLPSSSQPNYWHEINESTQYQYTDSMTNENDIHLLQVGLSPESHVVTSQHDQMHLPLIQLDTCSQQTFWLKQQGVSHKQLSPRLIYDFILSDAQFNEELNITIRKDSRIYKKSKHRKNPQQNSSQYGVPLSKISLRSYYDDESDLLLCEMTLNPHQIYALMTNKPEKDLSSLAIFQSNPWLNGFKVSLSTQADSESEQFFITINFQPKDGSKSNVPISTGHLKPICFEKDATIVMPEQGGCIAVNCNITDGSYPVTVRVTNQTSGSLLNKLFSSLKQLLKTDKLKRFSPGPDDIAMAKLTAAVASPVLLSFTPLAPAAFAAPILIYHGDFIKSYISSKLPSLRSSKESPEADAQRPEDETHTIINQVRIKGKVPGVLLDLAVSQNGSSTEFTLIPKTGLDSDPQPSLLNIIQAKHKETKSRNPLSFTFESLLEYTGDLQDLPAYIKELGSHDSHLQLTSAALNITNPVTAINKAIRGAIKDNPQAKSSIELMGYMLDSAPQNAMYQTAVALLSGYKLHAPDSEEVTLLLSQLDSSQVSKSKCIIGLEKVAPQKDKPRTKQSRTRFTRTSPPTGAAVAFVGSTIFSIITGSGAAPTIEQSMRNASANATEAAPITTTTEPPSYYKKYFIRGTKREGLRYLCTEHIGNTLGGDPVYQELIAPEFCEKFNISDNQAAQRYMGSFFEISEIRGYGCTTLYEATPGLGERYPGTNYGIQTIHNGTATIDHCLSEYATDKCGKLVEMGVDASTNNACHVCEIAADPKLRCGYKPPSTTSTTTTTTPEPSNPSLNNPSFNNPSLNNPSFNNPSFNNPSFNNPSFNNPSFNNPSFNNPSFNNPSLNNPSLNNDSSN